jgi:pSer/pThr/pTyr-binding forkhead associated (FHA) protein
VKEGRLRPARTCSPEFARFFLTGYLFGCNLRAVKLRKVILKMKRAPVIVVQIIHILGPSKGEIQELNESVISIGRQASCHIRFPVGLTGVSRNHAEIVRDGNQFKLVDHSTNGTFVNGKKVKEVLLKNGDVLEFSEGGPKVSFLTQMKEIPLEEPARPTREQPREEPIFRGAPEDQQPLFSPQEAIKPQVRTPEPRKPETAAPPIIERQDEIPPQHAAMPLIIQYGPTLRSFKVLPVTLGKSSKCNFVVDHPAIFDQHAQIFFNMNEYWIMDLTGQRSIHLNGQPISLKASLKANDEIGLSSRGPFFRYLGEGRLVEMEVPPPSPGEAKGGLREEAAEVKEPKKSSSVFKKFFRS